MKQLYSTLALGLLVASSMAQLDPNTAPKSPIDRFSAAAGHLMVRDSANGLPLANAAIDFDVAPFITMGLGPNGEFVQYYNFDVQSTTPAPIYVLQRTGETSPVSGQLNIVNVKPGDAGYNDFWQVNMVTVPANYVANTVTSYQAIMNAGYSINTLSTIVNCPMVPEGSTAQKRLNNGDNSLSKGWYKDSVITYFNFMEKELMVNGNMMVPTSPIYVTFNINPGQTGGGPPSGFVVEQNTMQTHNVIATLPSSASYSPLWKVNIYDNANFGSVMNLTTASNANILMPGAADVNCPVVSISTATGIQSPDLNLNSNIYPNPFLDFFTLNISSDKAQTVTVSVVNTLGESLINSTENLNGSFQKKYDISYLASGTYFIIITSDGNLNSQRVIKKQ